MSFVKHGVTGSSLGVVNIRTPLCQHCNERAVLKDGIWVCSCDTCAHHGKPV
jgi:ribosomal protein L37AE/L43A